MNKSTTLKIRLEPELKQEAMKQAAQADLSLSELLRRALRLELPVKTGGADG